MKKVSNFIVVTIAAMAFSFMSINAQGFSNEASATAIGQEVHKRILRLPRYELYDHIGFEVKGDTVTLNGSVRNAINRSDAEGTVKRISGVNHVINNIQLLPLSGFDDQIRRTLTQRIANTGGLSGYLWPVNPPVRLIVNNGHISLEGKVRNRGDYNMMYIAARSVPSSFTVTNNLVVENDVAR
ncbi:MAG: BON domain-containing protein [Blastocatellia bacterium]|nr:BON domain-containing protein [Blastocatellia bacterium]